MAHHFNRVIKKIGAKIWELFLRGLLTILPLAITLGLFNFSFKMIVMWLEPLKRWEPSLLISVPYAEVIVALIIIVTVGIIINVLFVDWLLRFFEGIIFKIPLVRPVYSGIKQLVHAFNPQDDVSFKQVALVEFPRKGVYSLGFVTSEVPPALAPSREMSFTNVFIPTTPNPTTGYFVMIPTQDIAPINITRQEAMAMIISGGIIQPERFK